jgi:hypothetical protein
MSYALIDNATLTAVQRITGDVTSRSRTSIDVDLVAYENYVQARLFYDEVIALDDYIPKFREARRSAFPAITFVSPDDLKLKELAEEANKLSNNIKPEIRGGKFANSEFKSLFELLQSHMICTWDVSSSVYYLNLKVLAEPYSEEFDKYGAIASAIFNELGDVKEAGGKTSSDVALVDRYGKPITKGYTVPYAKWGGGDSGAPSGAISAFVASLVWLSNRAIYYTLASNHLKADSFLYPMRQSYQQYYLSKTLNYGMDFTNKIVKQFSTTLGQDLVDVHNNGIVKATAVDIPIFSAWLANACGDTAAGLYALEEIRMQQEFVEARGQLNDLRNAAEEGKSLQDTNKKALKFQTNLSKISNAMREKYSIKTRQGIPLTRLVSVYNAYAAIHALPPAPKIDLSIKLPQVLKDMKRQWGFFSVYRNVMNDLATIGALGETHDVLTARIKIDDQLGAYYPKAEAPRYQNAHSSYKSPM